MPDELSLPADYVPTDYTSLPPEEPKPSNPMRFILPLIVLLLVLGAGVYAVFFMNTTPPDDLSTPVPQAKVTFDRSQMIIRDEVLTTQIDATLENVADGTDVTASLLENGTAFDFFDAEKTVEKVEGGKVKFTIPENDSHEAGRESATYTVRLMVAGVETPFDNEIKIAGGALDRFLGEGVAAAEPTTAPTLPVIIEPTAGPDQPTAAPEPPTTAPPSTGGVPVPLDNVVVSRAGIAYGTPYGPALQQGTVNANDVARIVVKLPVGSEVWYLAAIPATGVAGWINSNLIDLPASDVNRITPVSGEAPFAVVRNGGNVRSAPGADVLRQVEAGLNVRLVERTGDSAWFKIEINPGETGWVSGQLLTINPSVLAGVAVAP